MRKLAPMEAQLNHLITGQPYHPVGTPLSPNGTALQPEHNPVDVLQPMDWPTPGDGNFTGQSAETIQQQNLTSALGMDSGDGRLGQSPVDMAQANGCYDSPDKGGLGYGNPNTGRQS